MKLQVSSKLKLRGPQYIFAAAVLIPVVFIFTVMRIIPVGGTLLLSLYDWSLVRHVKRFIGFKNYLNLFSDRLFLLAIKNTFILAFISIAITLVIALSIAYILNRKKMRFSSVYELIYFIPFVISWVPLGVIWKWIYDPTYGILNYIVGIFGVKPIGWLINPNIALYSIILLIIWRNVGLNTVLFSVGFKNIPEEYFDAASIDGANKIQIFRHITFPLLIPITLYLIVMSTILNFSVFAPVYVMTIGAQGAPGNAVRVLVLDIYENGFRYFHMGYAAAESAMLLIIVLLITLVEFRLIRHDS